MEPAALLATSRATSGAQLSRDAIAEVAEEFESVFLSTMMQQMFAEIETDGPFGGGKAEETWRSMLVEEYGRSIAAAGGVGIADEIARELLAFQEAETHEQVDD